MRDKMMKNFFKAIWKAKHQESKEKRKVGLEEMKEETPELEQVEQDAQEEIREAEDEE
ncbi:MAG TPA: hypothetical protein VLT10_00565 [Verrucomicrobiae bacterium]|nr:hypothetical protein [Verrucomicrobiae bacterium]